MKAFVSSALLAALCISFVPTQARAECYGDAAAMYGCGAAGGSSGKGREGSLEYFGDSRAPVLPNVAYDQAESISDQVVTNQDRRRMLRSIVLGSGRRPYSQRTHIQALNNSGRPLRRSGSISQGVSGR
jgi:hypothetical protein